jgi:hypothetical protein
LQASPHACRPRPLPGVLSPEPDLTGVPTNYVECPDCGKRALSVATRCPHCGFHFPPRPIIRPSPQAAFGASRGLIAVGGAVVTLIIVALVVRHGRPEVERTAGASPPTDSMPMPAAAGAAPAAGPEAAPPSGGPRIRRYAQTWVNVRGDRTMSAPAVGMLNPGDAVTVDSLVRGWYRVSVDGRTLGYVHRSMLDVSRPE